MIFKEKFNLAEMLAEIDDEIHEQTADLSQLKNIPQDVITNLMIENLRKKRKTASVDNPAQNESAKN